MKSVIFSFLLFSTLLFSCQKNIEQPANNTLQSPGELTMKIDMTNAPAKVSAIRGMLIRNVDTLRFDFEIKDNYAQAFVDNLQPGTWLLKVDALDAQGTVRYTGSTNVLVVAGQITPVYLQLNSVTGAIEIIVTWGDNNPDLLAYFPFDSTLDDYSPLHNNAKPFGNVRFARGVRGAAVEFDGIDDYLQIDHLDAYNGDEKSISFWFYKNNDSIRDTPNLDDVEGLIFKSYDTGLRRDFSFSLGLQNPPFNVAFVIYQNTDSLTFLKLYERIQPRTWYHVVGTYNKTSARFYVNGELVIEAPITHPIYHSDAPIIVGTVPPPGHNFTRFFNGKMDELAIFNHALTQAEVQKIYKYGISK